MSDTIQPWTIKNVPPEARNAAIQAAERAGQPIGVWVARKLLEAAQADAQGSRAVVVRAPRPMVPLDALEALARTAAHVAALPDDGPRGFRRSALRELRRQLRGVPPA